MLKRLLIGFVLASAPLYAAAADIYLGASFGRASLTGADTGETVFNGEATVVDENDDAFKVVGGVYLYPNLAVELSYQDLGRVEIVVDSTELGIDTVSIGVAVVGAVPLPKRLKAFGKLGFHAWEQELMYKNTKLASDDGADLQWGFGLAVGLTDRVAFRTEYERFDVDTENLSLVSIGLNVEF